MRSSRQDAKDAKIAKREWVLRAIHPLAPLAFFAPWREPPAQRLMLLRNRHERGDAELRLADVAEYG